MTEESDRPAGILIVDDEPTVVEVARRALSLLTDDITVAESGKQAVDICLSRSFDLVISDVRMPGMDGIELLQLLAHDYPRMRRVILTGHGDLDQAMKAINLGRVHRYLTKPWKLEELNNAVAEELRLGEQERSEIVRLREVINKLVK